MMSLKSFIKATRAAKTISGERTVIQKESAAIRTSLRNKKLSRSQRRQNIAKLLFLYTIGERTHFGQVGCLELIASPQFVDKRLGYLGTMLILDENQEVLMLVTNSIDNDLNHPNQYVVSLALCTLANIASTEMSRDLFPKIEKLITSSNSYLKKKAAVCALRIIRRVPELEEHFIEHTKALLESQNHGVLLAGASLATDMLENNPVLVDQFAICLPTVINRLKLLNSAGYSPEYDVSGIPDPFLQTRLLRLLKMMGQGSKTLSDQMADTLAAIATNTDGTRTVGNAVLYETVLTIFGIEADSGLRVLGINILGKFLTTKDNNTRYVALNTLLKVVTTEPVAVQRHRATIVECFADPDVSIKRRALELAYALINGQNVRVMVRELLTFLETCDQEFKLELVSQIALAAEKFAPNSRWHLDTLLRTLLLAGSQAKENVLSAFILLVVNNPDLQLYAVRRVYLALKNDFSQRGLSIVSLWLLGEFGSVLVEGGTYDDPASEGQVHVNMADIVQLILDLFESPFVNPAIEEYGLNSLIKLTTSVDAQNLERIRKALAARELSLNIEIQQRAVEYGKLLTHPELRNGVLARMPGPPYNEDLAQQHAKEVSKQLVKRRRRPAMVAAAAGATTEAIANLLDLDTGVEEPTPQSMSTEISTNDLLADIFGASTSSTSAGTRSKAHQDILGSFSVEAESNNSQSHYGSFANPELASSLNAAVQAWADSNMSLSFSVVSKSTGRATLKAIFQASVLVDNISLQVAVPKSQKLVLQRLSANKLLPGKSAEQELIITGPVGAPIRLRLRIHFSVNGKQEQFQIDFNGLEQNL